MCVCLQVHMRTGAHGGWKSLLCLLGLELQAVMSSLTTGAGTQTRVLCKSHLPDPLYKLLIGLQNISLEDCVLIFPAD